MFSDWLTFFWQQITHPEAVQPGIYNLPWFFFVLQPLQLVGKYPALFIVQLATIGIVIYLCRKMSVPWRRVILVLLSAPVYSHIVMGQIDGLILLSYALPALPAAALVLSKPQTALWAGYEAFRKKPVPVIIFCAALVVTAFIVWGWPFSISDASEVLTVQKTLIPPFFRHEWNWTFFPWAFLAIPIALKKGKKAGMILSPFLFPYAALNSLIGPIIAVATLDGYWFLAVWVIFWLRWAWMAGFFPK